MNKLSAILLVILVHVFTVQASEMKQLDDLAALSKEQLISIATQMKNDSEFQAGDKSPYLLELQKHPEVFSSDIKSLSMKNRTLMAKHIRYDTCTNSLSLYFKKAKNAKGLSQEADFDTKEKWLAYISMSAGLNYPYTEQEMASSLRYPDIIALEKAWQYKKNPNDGVLNTFNTCMKIPLKRYIDNL